MLNRKELKRIARARFRDAKILLTEKRFDGAVYLCGYAIELGLKSRICKTLKWQEYPQTKSEFEKYRSFKTHDLDVLLHMSGIEANIKNNFLTEWSAVSQWSPMSRYQPIGKIKIKEARQMLTATNKLLTKL